MSNDAMKILKESIDRHRREEIQHYFTMDIDHFEENFKTQVTAIIQTAKSVIPPEHIDKLTKHIKNIDFHGDVKDGHIKSIGLQQQEYIDDIFDDMFFDFFEEFDIFEVESINDGINSLFTDNTINSEYAQVLETPAYNLSEDVDQYLEQFTSSNDEYTNTQNQEMDMS